MSRMIYRFEYCHCVWNGWKFVFSFNESGVRLLLYKYETSNFFDNHQKIIHLVRSVFELFTPLSGRVYFLEMTFYHCYLADCYTFIFQLFFGVFYKPKHKSCHFIFWYIFILIPQFCSIFCWTSEELDFWFL